MEELNQFSTVAVDYSGGVPDDFILKLHQYKGRIILLCSDPVMDALYENWTAGIAYGLCGASTIDPADCKPAGIRGIRTAFAESLIKLK